MDTVLPEDVQRFLASHIDSIEKLEILLLLSRAPAQSWSAAEVSRELRSSDDWTLQNLAYLEGRGLVVEESGRFRFEPKDEAARNVVPELARCYATARVRVVTFIYSRPRESVQSFADAFRLRKGKDNG